MGNGGYMLKGLIKTTAVILLLAALAFLPVQIFAEETKDVDIYDLPIEENDSLYGRIIFVDPGHGIGCGGAYGGDRFDGAYLRPRPLCGSGGNFQKGGSRKASHSGG